MRPVFYLERWNGRCWANLFSAPHQIGLSDLRGPEGDGGMTGRPGFKARIRVDEMVVEEFDWALIPSNPLDPESFKVWGWKSLGRHYEGIAEKFKDDAKGLSFLG